MAASVTFVLQRLEHRGHRDSVALPRWPFGDWLPLRSLAVSFSPGGSASMLRFEDGLILLELVHERG